MTTTATNTTTKPKPKRRGPRWPKEPKRPAKSNPGYLIDVRCDEVFSSHVHAYVFRLAMLSAHVREHVAVGDQFEVAGKVAAKVEALERKLGRRVSSDVVVHLVDALVADMERTAKAA